jgi:hypothetical protein
MPARGSIPGTALGRLLTKHAEPAICSALGRCGTATATYRRGGSGGSVVSNCSPRNVIVASREQAPFAVHFESLPTGPEYRSVVTHQLHSGVTLRDLIEREGEGS